MEVKAGKTAIWTWTCPECGIDNEHFLTEDELLPNELDCDFCPHESGLIDWSKAPEADVDEQ